MPDGGANLPGHQWVLLGGIIANEQKRRSRSELTHGGEDPGGLIFGARSAGPPGQGRNHAGVIGSTMMINVVRAHGGTGHASEQAVFFVGGAVGTQETDGLGAALRSHGGQASRRV